MVGFYCLCSVSYIWDDDRYHLLREEWTKCKHIFGTQSHSAILGTPLCHFQGGWLGPMWFLSAITSFVASRGKSQMYAYKFIKVCSSPLSRYSFFISRVFLLLLLLFFSSFFMRVFGNVNNEKLKCSLPFPNRNCFWKFEKQFSETWLFSKGFSKDSFQ